MRLKFIGTGNAAGMPAYGCDCPACIRAKNIIEHRRGPCSAALMVDDQTLLLDAGSLQLPERFPAGSFSRVLLTHYHMDHVQGLFPIRWGVGDIIPVHGPDDKNGCDDLFKHPGILDFSDTLTAFEQRQFDKLIVTPLPLNHSKLCLGYAFEHGGKRLAYLTDTVGLPEQTEQFLQDWSPDVMILDCSMPPQARIPKNHNDLTMAIEVHERIAPKTTYLTHISHSLDNWLSNNIGALPQAVCVATDGLIIDLGK
ncbi:MAG: phosphonate metabolism protein PhnP [Gammaproteobacteria bacterium]|nr:phosphonate metabolism protein PhnP [Gammaproteobacteria bacterium]